MKSKVSKDVYNRVYFFIENKLLISSYKDIPKNVIKKVFFKKKSFFTHIKNRCVLSGRSRFVLSKFRISRIFFRNIALEAKLSGVKKQSW